MDGFLLIGVERKKAKKFYLSFVSIFFHVFFRRKIPGKLWKQKTKNKIYFDAPPQSCPICHSRNRSISLRFRPSPSKVLTHTTNKQKKNKNGPQSCA